jgi:hypothetical protein
MHTDDTLIEPTLTIHDLGRKQATVTASSAIALALRKEARSDLDEAITRIERVRPGSDLSWQQIHDLEAVLSKANDALHILRATTAAPEED